MLKRRLIALLCSVGLLPLVTSCTGSNHDSLSEEQPSILRLPRENLFNFLRTITSGQSNDLNYHVWYSEQLNDSTGIVQITLNNRLPDQEIGFCEILSFEKHNVFVYEGACEAHIPDSLFSSVNPNPFYALHSPNWVLLIKRRKDVFQLFQLNIISSSTEQDHSAVDKSWN